MLSKQLRVVHILAAGLISFTPFSSVAYAQGAVGPQAEITFDLRARHDSNVARAGAERARLRGLSKDDQRITPTLSAEIVYPLGRNNARLSASAGYDFYRRNTRLNSERLLLDGGATIDVNICDLDLNAGISRRQSDLGDIVLLTANPEAAIENKETTHFYGAGLSCGNPIGLRPSASIRRTIGDNSNPLRELSNYATTTFNTGLGYSNPAIGDISLYATRSETEFKNELQRFLRGDYVSRGYGLRLERDIGARWTANLDIGYTNVDSSGLIRNNFSGATYSAALTGRLGPSLQLSAGLGRAVTTGLNNDASYTVNTDYFLDADYAINDRFTVSAGYSHAKRDYFYNRDFPAGLLLTDDRQDRFTGSLRYNLRPKTQLVFAAGHERRNANGDFFDYKNTYASFSISQSF